MEGPGGNKQNVVRTDHAVLGVHRAAFHNGQQIALHALSRDVRSAVLRGAGDLVDFVNKNDAALLHPLLGAFGQGFLIHQLARLFLNQHVEGVADFHLAAAAARRKSLAEHILDLAAHLFHARNGENVDALTALLGHFHFHFPLV